MRTRKLIPCCLAAFFITFPGFTSSQDASQNRTLIVNGQTTQVPVVQVNGRAYVDLEALAGALNGSISFAGSQIAFSVPNGSATSAPAATSARPVPATVLAPTLGFSKGFLNAGIEEAATLREWHTALAAAIQNGYPVTAGMLAPYRAQATTNLRLAMTAASTDSDHSAYQLLNNEFQNMAKMSDRYIAARAAMTYISPDALENDNSNQRFIACGHSLGAMAASGQFADDGSCE